MATKHRLLPFSTGSTALVLLLLFLGVLCVQAQPPSNGNGSSNNNNDDNKPYLSSTNFNPSMAIIIVVLISAFFFLGFFSIYIRQCGGEQIDTATAFLGGRSRRPRGLDPAILETFPIMVYSEVKEHKIGKGALECAICLNEFEDDDTIRLLIKCDHVFHQECIDAWLTNHVTCPVCRTNYTAGGSPTEGEETATVAPEPVEAAAAPTQEPPATNQVAISVIDKEERKEDIREMARIAMRRNGSRRPTSFQRSHSTGHSVMVRDGECLERYTLRLPENVRKDIIAAGGLQRVRSFAVSYGTEGSSRRVGRGVGEGSSRRNRGVRLGRSDRWPSFFVRSLSAKIPAWGSWRRGEEGSVKNGSVGAAAAGSKHNTTVDPDESSTAALNRV